MIDSDDHAGIDHMRAKRQPARATVAMLAAAAVVLGIALSALIPDAPPADDGVRPAWIGTCGGISYRWHYDPRTVPSGSDCVVERIER